MEEKKVTKKCPKCSEEIPSKAKLCPQCGEKIKPPFYKRWWFIVLVIVLVIGMLATLEESEPLPKASDDSTKVEQTEPSSSSSDSNSSETDSQTTTEPAEPTKPAEPAPTMGELNALGTAENYLSMGGFSKKSLKEQLEYEGYSSSEIEYAVKNCDADWKAQAAISAQNYLNTQSFSRQSLYGQLEYEGFSSDQIEYALSAVGY